MMIFTLALLLASTSYAQDTAVSVSPPAPEAKYRPETLQERDKCILQLYQSSMIKVRQALGSRGIEIAPVTDASGRQYMGWPKFLSRVGTVKSDQQGDETLAYETSIEVTDTKTKEKATLLVNSTFEARVDSSTRIDYEGRVLTSLGNIKDPGKKIRVTGKDLRASISAPQLVNKDSKQALDLGSEFQNQFPLKCDFHFPETREEIK